MATSSELVQRRYRREALVSTREEMQAVTTLQLFATFKGQGHEMNNFFEGLKNQISTFCIGTDVYLGPACPALNSLGLRLRKSSFPPGGITRGTSASQCQQYCRY